MATYRKWRAFLLCVLPRSHPNQLIEPFATKAARWGLRTAQTPPRLAQGGFDFEASGGATTGLLPDPRSPKARAASRAVLRSNGSPRAWTTEDVVGWASERKTGKHTPWRRLDQIGATEIDRSLDRLGPLPVPDGLTAVSNTRLPDDLTLACEPSIKLSRICHSLRLDFRRPRASNLGTQALKIKSRYIDSGENRPLTPRKNLSAWHNARVALGRIFSTCSRRARTFKSRPAPPTANERRSEVRRGPADGQRPTQPSCADPQGSTAAPRSAPRPDFSGQGASNAMWRHLPGSDGLGPRPKGPKGNRVDGRPEEHSPRLVCPYDDARAQRWRSILAWYLIEAVRKPLIPPLKPFPTHSQWLEAAADRPRGDRDHAAERRFWCRPNPRRPDIKETSTSGRDCMGRQHGHQ